MLTTVAERYSSQYSLHKTHLKPKSDVGLTPMASLMLIKEICQNTVTLCTASKKEAGKCIVHVFHDQEFVRMLLVIKRGPLPMPMHVSYVIPSSPYNIGTETKVSTI